MRRDLGWVLHGLGGVGIGAVGAVAVMLTNAGVATSAVVLLATVAATALFGWAREIRQHWPGWRLSRHQWIEALAWPAGAVVGAAVARTGGGYL